MPKNQGLYVYFTLKTKKKDTFFNFHSSFWKPEKSTFFSQKKKDIFRICVRYKVNQLSWVIFLLTNRKKAEKRIFSSFFSFLSLLYKYKKSRFFFAFLCFDFLVDSCQIKAGIPIFSPLDWQLSKMTGNCEQWVVRLIYKCPYAVAHFVLRQCFKMSDVYVEINMNEK